MKWIAWDTSSPVGAIATWIQDSNEASLETLSLDVGSSQHSENLLEGIDTLLRRRGWKAQDLGGIAVGVGPGSFTGLRIGVTIARTLAHTLGKKLLPLPSLSIVAEKHREIWETFPQATLIVATNAYKGEAFVKAQTIRNWSEEASEWVVDPSRLGEIEDRLGSDLEKGWILIGEGRHSVRGFKEALEAKWGAPLWEPPIKSDEGMGAEELGRVAMNLIQSGNPGKTALEVHPRYLKVSSAEEKLKAGLVNPKSIR